MLDDLTIVGKENLPNVYIKSIRVVPKTKRLFVLISCFDHKDSPSWFDRFNMKIKLCPISNLNSQMQINNGVSGLYDFQGIVIEAKDMTKSPSSNFQNLIEYSYEFELKISNMVNVNIYCCAFYEMQNKFSNDFLNRFYGPISGERVVIEGQENRKSGRFFKTDTGELYMGPVHQISENMYMEGSFHKGSGQSNLVYIEEENNKISYDESNEMESNEALSTSSQTNRKTSKERNDKGRRA